MHINKNLGLFLLYIVVTILLRFFSFSPSVLEHDESTYLVIGRDILQGEVLYTDVTDTKPVGIFLIYAFFQFISGYSIFYKRLLVAVITGASAYLLFKSSEKLFANRRVAIAGGFIYILYTSTWNYFGLSPNTELFFNFFTIAGLLLFLRKANLSYFLGGLLLGVGFIIKYLVLLDYVAIVSFFMVMEFLKSGEKLSFKFIAPYFLSGIGFSIPFILVNLYFFMNSNFTDFYFVTYKLPGRYSENAALWPYLKMLLDFTGRFLPFSIIFFYVMFSKSGFLKKWVKPFFIVWITGVLIAIYLPGKGFSHYTIQLMLPISMVSGLFFHPELQKTQFTRVLFEKRVGALFLILFVVAMQFVSIKTNFLAADYNQEVADYLKKGLSEKDIVYVSNYEQVIYYLLKKESPTKYVHSSILSTDLYKAYDIDNKSEIRRIIRGRPKYVLVWRKFGLVQDMIKNDYQLDKTFYNGQILVYLRKS